MGLDYSGLMLENTTQGIQLSQVVCKDADKGNAERVNVKTIVSDQWIYLRAAFDKQAFCRFSYSLDGKTYQSFGEPFQAKEGKWIGSKIGTFCTRPALQTNDGGWAEVDWFRVSASEKPVTDPLKYAIRIADSEMRHCPESWQLDFQPTLKWDYCHGLELQAFLDLYKYNGDERYLDYAGIC